MSDFWPACYKPSWGFALHFLANVPFIITLINEVWPKKAFFSEIGILNWKCEFIMIWKVPVFNFLRLFAQRGEVELFYRQRWKKKQSNTFYLLWLNAPCISRPLKCRSREFSKQNFLFSKKWQKFSNNSSNQVNHQLRLWGNSPVKEFQVYKCYRNNVK